MFEGEHEKYGVPQVRVRKRRSAVYLAFVISFGACGSRDAATPAATEMRSPADAATTTIADAATTTIAEAATTTIAASHPTAVENSPRPPPIQLRGGGREFSLSPWSYCWSAPPAEGATTASVCADGFGPPEALTDVGNPDEIEISFPVTNFSFTATTRRHGERCGREQTVTLTSTGPSTHRLLPVGKAGDYVVTLAGRSGEGVVSKGQLSASFRWHTPRDGPNEAPTAYVTASKFPSWPTELRVDDLRTTPKPGRVAATAVVTSREGMSTTIDLQRQSVKCADDGSVLFRGDTPARRGSPPFRYVINLVIDSVHYRGTATWPDDVDPERSPSIPLKFNPPLPGL